MAIDLVKERTSSLAPRPKISFSHENVHGSKSNNLYRSDSSSMDSSYEFKFCISNSSEFETCSADELFCDGLIRPLELQARFVVPKSLCLPKPSTIQTSQENNCKGKIILPPNSNKSKSFWPIKRSYSLHCNRSKKGTFWSLPLLSRSKSTGSMPKESPKSSPNPNKKPKRLTGSSAASSVYFKQHSLRKSYRGSSLNGVRICPVIYVTPPCSIKGTINLFGLGSLFRNGKDKKSKK